MSTTIATAAPALTLRSGAVHVWHAALPPRSASAAALADVCSDAERERASRLRDPARGERYLAGRATVRQVLGAYLARPAAAVALDVDAAGKPFVATGEVSFNLSHSGGLLVVAVAADSPVGVDVEQRRDDVDIDAVARRFFTPSEQHALAALPAGAVRAAGFWRTWTRKEAVVKADGSGLRTALASVGVPLADPLCRWSTVDGRWLVADLTLPSGYLGAVASGFPRPRLETRPWPPPLSRPPRLSPGPVEHLEETR